MLEARGESSAAVEMWARAHALDASRADVRLGYAQSLIRANRPAEALPHLEALVAAPGAPAAAWLATGVAYALLGRHDDAEQHSAKAASLAPGVVEVHLGHGDVLYRAGDAAAARLAYERAHAIAPNHPDVLNKLATIARMQKRRPEAQALLERAVRHSDDHAYARYNLATMALRDGRFDDARRGFAATLAADGLPDEVRVAATDAIAMFDERDRLAAPTAEALASGDAAPLVRAVGSRARDLPVDRPIAEAFRRIADRASASPSIDDAFAPLADRSGRWHAIEAHFTYRFDGDAAALERDSLLVDGRAPPAEDVDADVVGYARAAQARRTNRPPADDADALDAWLRLAHARLVANRHDYWPGFYKPTNSTPRADPKHARVPAASAAGTMRNILLHVARRFPPGGWRATLVLFAILRLHPFLNGNKRLARFLANGELEAAGLMPHANLPGAIHELVRRVGQAWKHEDPRPVADWLATESRRAARLDADQAARGAR